ncbi:MAG: ThuA domain-containing protein [Candidatus Sumerlaeota bacterium]|nr:ThuA domain-containing protein [Candidatus Sumerlaeota bacterium]
MRPNALLLMGGTPPHHTPAHYELLAGLLAGPAGLSLITTDELQALTEESLRRYDLLALWSDRLPPATTGALFEAVRRGVPLLIIHTGVFPVGNAPGGAEAIGSAHLGPHFPRQKIRAHIEDRSHPITSGVDDFDIVDEPYRLAPTGNIHLLASYDARQMHADWGKPAPDERQEQRRREAEAWSPARAPLLYNKRLGAGRIHVNALGHDPESLGNPAFQRLVVQAAAWLLAE